MEGISRMFIRQSVCPFVFINLCLSAQIVCLTRSRSGGVYVCQSACLSVSISALVHHFILCLFATVCLPFFPPVCLPLCISLCLSLSVYHFVHLSDSLSFSLSRSCSRSRSLSLSLSLHPVWDKGAGISYLRSDFRFQFWATNPRPTNPTPFTMVGS